MDALQKVKQTSSSMLEKIGKWPESPSGKGWAVIASFIMFVLIITLTVLVGVTFEKQRKMKKELEAKM